MKRLLFNLKWGLYKPAVFKAYQEALRMQYLPPEALAEIVEERKQAIVRHAMTNTQFYRKLYKEAGIELTDIGKEGWFERLPVLTKEHLRTNLEEITDQFQCQHRAFATTGGSTGIPTKTGYDRRYPTEAMRWRFQSWYDVNPWDDQAYVWRQTRSRFGELMNSLLWWPTRHIKLDASFMTEKSILLFLSRYNRLRPSVLEGYVGAIVQLSQYVRDHNLNVHSPKCVWVTSAPISEVQKVIIKEVFDAPILNQYGSCEVSSIAQSCPCDHGLHVNVDRVNVEYVDGANKPVPTGEFGKTLLTNLVDTVFPLIRYENGDRGRLLPELCPCGRTLPLIDSVKGRESESFVLPSGKTINGEYLTTIFDAAPELVNGFRVIQHRDHSITVECIPSSDQDVPRIESVVNDFSAKIGGEVPVECRVVREIAHDRGKLRFVMREK